MMLTDITKRLRHLWRVYGTLNNSVLAVALIIAAGWTWGTIATMQTNFDAQKSVDDQKKQLELTKLQVETLKYQQNYYNSDEYKELAAREDLGLAAKGEKVLILPPNSAKVKKEDADSADVSQRTATATTESNFEQWINFLTGRNARSLQN